MNIVPLMPIVPCHFFSQTAVLLTLRALPKHNQPQDVLIQDVCVRNYLRKRLHFSRRSPISMGREEEQGYLLSPFPHST